MVIAADRHPNHPRLSLYKTLTKITRTSLVFMVDYVFIFRGKIQLRSIFRHISGERFQLGRTRETKKKSQVTKERRIIAQHRAGA